MSVVAKFKVSHVDAFEYSSTVFMHPVMPPADDTKVTSKEDGAFWEATPSGELKMNINNAAAAEQFQPGKSYYLTFEPADG